MKSTRLEGSDGQENSHTGLVTTGKSQNWRPQPVELPGWHTVAADTAR
jgi:hypothetical protein